MSQKKAKRARQTTRPAPQPAWRGPASRRRWIGGGILAALLAAALITGVVVARGNGPARASAAHNGGDALSLSGVSPITGKRVSLAEFAGKPIVLNVWGSWCTGCIAEARDLARFERAHPEAQVVGIDLEDTDGGARAFYRRYGFTHPSIADPHGEIASRLSVQGTPTTFFLDRRHRIVASVVGATDAAGFEQGLRAAEHA